jgi:putative transcriptional regulator
VSRVERGIIQGLEEAVRFERGAGRAAVRSHVRTAAGAVVIEARGYRGRQIRRIRGDLRLSQPVFAKLLNVSPETVKAWEQGKRVPEGAAVRLLEVAEDHPEVLLPKLRVRRGGKQ